MKTIVLVMACCWTINFAASAQCVEDPNWDWEDTSGSNWFIYPEDTSTVVAAGSPFENAQGTVLPVADAGDYKKEDGWLLIRKDFGCTLRQIGLGYFILYNKYTGILRFFAYNSISALATGAKVTLAHGNSSINYGGILNYTKSIAFASDRYPVENQDLEDLGVNVGNRTDANKWLMAEFVMAFDHRTNEYLNKLSFFVDFVQINQIELDGETESTFEYLNSTNYQVASNKSQKCETGACNTSKVLADGAKAVSSLPNSEEFKNGLTSFASSLSEEGDKDGNFLERLSYDISEFAKTDVVRLLSIPTGVGKVLSFVSKTFDFFSGQKKSETSTPDQFYQFTPTGMYGTLSLKGTMTSEQNVTEVPLQIPGSIYTQSGNLPFYNCPLGIATLKNTPIIESKLCKPFRSEIAREDVCYVNRFFTFKSFNLRNDLIFTVNGSSDLVADKVEFAYVFEILDLDKDVVNTGAGSANGTYNFFNDDNKERIRLHCGFDVQTNPVTEIYNNPFYRIFADKHMEIVGVRDTMIDSETSKIYTISSSYVDITAAKNMSFTSMVNSKLIGIKVRAVLLPNNSNLNPVLFTQIFKADLINLNSGNEEEQFPIQPSQRNADFIYLNQSNHLESRTYGKAFVETEDLLNLGSNNYTISSENAVILKPGFSTNEKINFTASIQDDSFGNQNDFIEYFYTDCDENSIIATETYEDITNYSEEKSIIVSPNPADIGDQIKVNVKPLVESVNNSSKHNLFSESQVLQEQTGSIKVKVVDILGREIARVSTSENSNVVDLSEVSSSLHSGVYLIVSEFNGVIKSTKLFVN